MFNELTQRAIKQIQNEAEKLRHEASSPGEIISGLESLFIGLGVKLTFIDYPTSFDESVSCTHASPIGFPTNWGGRNNTDPRGYPGWTGAWKGTIELLKNHKLGSNVKEFKFDDIADIIPWMSYGTGCPGAEFRISGEIWMYDFTKIKAEYEENGGIVKDKKNHFKKLLETYSKELVSQQIHTVESDPEMQRLKQLSEIIGEAFKQLNELTTKKRKAIVHTFNKTHEVPIPTPPSSFVGTEEIKHVHNEKGYESAVVHPDCKEIFTRIADIVGEMETYRNDNPEIFI